MNQLWKLPFVLMITTLIAASALSLVNTSTKPLIEEHNRQVILEALKIVSSSRLEGVNLPIYEDDKIIDTSYKNIQIQEKLLLSFFTTTILLNSLSGVFFLGDIIRKSKKKYKNKNSFNIILDADNLQLTYTEIF